MITQFIELIKSIRQDKREKRIIAENERRIKILLNSSNPIKLELGAGCNRGINGWTYIDNNEKCNLVMNLKNSIPFPDNSVSEIYSSHFLEHFTYPELIRLFEECLRILKPKGIFKAAVPNARLYLEAYSAANKSIAEFFFRYKPAYNFNSKIDYVNYIAYMDGHHHYMFDEENILIILQKIGFNNVRLRDFDEALDLRERDYESIYVRAEK